MRPEAGNFNGEFWGLFSGIAPPFGRRDDQCRRGDYQEKIPSFIVNKAVLDDDDIEKDQGQNDYSTQ